MKDLLIKVSRKILKIVFGFDNWHVATLAERPYAVDVINYCNRLPVRRTFAEIGCGLGDITRNVLFDERRGFDMDPKVLKGARVLPSAGSKRPVFDTFVFPDSQLNGKVDVLTLVNWIHHIEPGVLKDKIEQYFSENINNGGRIIIDTVQDPAYRYNHNINSLTAGVGCTVERIGKYSRDREVWAIIKN